MNTANTAEQSVAGEAKILATYECDEGTRQLVGQRVNGTVHISDIPAGEEGRVYLVEPRIDSLDELNALVADYLAQADRLGCCPMVAGKWWG